MKELIRTDVLAVDLLKLDTEGLEDERGAPYLLLEWPGDSAGLEREKESLNALRDELDRVCVGEDADRIREAQRILPQLAPSDLRSGPGLLLSAPQDGLRPVAAGTGENPGLLKLLADYAWISTILFKNGVCCRGRHIQDLLLAPHACLVLNWAELDRSGTRFAAHFQDLRKVLEDCWGAGTGSRGLKRVMGLLDWPEAAGLGKEVAEEVMREVACILDNLETAWTTDRGKLLASAEAQWKDHPKRQLVADTLSVYRLRWPDDPAANALCSQCQQAQLETELERMLEQAREQVTDGRLDLAIQCLRWAAARAPASHDGQGLEVFQWLASTALVLEVQESKGEVLALVQALKGTTGERNVERLFRRYRERVAKPGRPGDDVGHPHCVLWQLAAMANFQQATAFGQGIGGAHQFYRLLVRARRAYQALPPPWRAGLHSLWGKEPGPIFDEVERRRRIIIDERRWWRGLPREEADKLAQDLRALEEAGERQREVPLAFPRDPEVEDIPFDLMGRLLALRRGGDPEVASSHGIAYREFIDLHGKRARRINRFLLTFNDLPKLPPPPAEAPTSVSRPTLSARISGQPRRYLIPFCSCLVILIASLYLAFRSTVDRDQGQPAPPVIHTPPAEDPGSGPRLLASARIYARVPDAQEQEAWTLELVVPLNAPAFEIVDSDCATRTYCKIKLFVYVADASIEPDLSRDLSRLKRMLPRREVRSLSDPDTVIGRLTAEASGLRLCDVEETASISVGPVPYRKVMIHGAARRTFIRIN